MLQVKRQAFKGVNEQGIITEEECLNQNEVYDCIRKAFKEHGIFNIDAIKIIDKSIRSNKLCIYVKYCGITIAMVISNKIHYDKFIWHLDNFAEAASCRLFDIDIFTINGITYIFEDSNYIK